MWQALKGGVREKVELATMFGISYPEGKWDIRGDPAYAMDACEGSLKRLGIDCIDLYYQHCIDTRVPIEVTVGVVTVVKRCGGVIGEGGILFYFILWIERLKRIKLWCERCMIRICTLD